MTLARSLSIDDQSEFLTTVQKKKKFITDGHSEASAIFEHFVNL